MTDLISMNCSHDDTTADWQVEADLPPELYEEAVLLLMECGELRNESVVYRGSAR